MQRSRSRGKCPKDKGAPGLRAKPLVGAKRAAWLPDCYDHHHPSLVRDSLQNLHRSGENQPFTGRNVHPERRCNGDAQELRPESRRFDEFCKGTYNAVTPNGLCSTRRYTKVIKPPEEMRRSLLTTRRNALLSQTPELSYSYGIWQPFKGVHHGNGRWSGDEAHRR